MSHAGGQLPDVRSDTDRAADEPGAALEAGLGTESLSQYARDVFSRIKGGESGMLPIVLGLVGIAIFFQVRNDNFLSAGNLTNLLVQGAVFMLLGMAEVFALLLAEIDLSVGFVAGIGGVIVAELVRAPRNWPWWSAIIIALLATTAIGFIQGSLITRLGLPSFVVTLAGLLGWQGLMIKMLGQGGTVPISDNVINNLANGNLSPAGGWIVMACIVAVYAIITVGRDARRRASGLVAPPVLLTAIKILVAAAAAVVLLVITNTDRGALVPIRGMPWVVLIVLGVLFAWTFLLSKMRFGRYVYAIGGNPEGARRAGINLAWVRTGAFALVGLTAGIAGIIYASRLRSVSTSLDGGTLVLYAIAAAVIGGTSLFGGRGKPLHAVLGGIVIATIYNGMGLLGMSAAAQFMVTAIVLVAAVIVDAVARRKATA